MALVLLLILLYAPVLLAAWNGQTLGRRALGIRVVKADLEPTGFWRALGREDVVKLVFNLSSVGTVIDPIVCLASADRRSLHDRICKTRVVRRHRGVAGLRAGGDRHSSVRQVI